MATIREFPEHTPPERGAQPEQAEHTQAPMIPAPRAQRRPRYGQPFWPTTFFGTSMYVLVTMAALIFLAIIHPAELQNPADPLNHAKFNPRPEWYFLFLFQILKIFQGPWEIVGTAIIPAVFGAILILLPFYDRNWSRRAVRRPFAVTAATVVIIGMIYLTYLPISQTATLQSNTSALLASAVPHPKFSNIDAIFAKYCQPCHYGGSTYTAGLNLTTYQGVMKGGSKSAGGVVDGAVIKPGDPMGSYLYLVVAWLPNQYHKLDGGAGANMPLGATSPIPKVDQQNIYNWIKDGAKDNG